jgi:hypothetical protein
MAEGMKKVGTICNIKQSQWDKDENKFKERKRHVNQKS